MTAVMLAVEQLTRRYGGLTAVDAVSFTVEEGEILGIVGPNGAGKTTLFNMIAGAVKPSSGAIVLAGTPVDGWDPEQAARRGLARTFQVMRPFESMTVLENVVVGALLRGGGVSGARGWAEHCVELVGLSPKLNNSAGQLSTGQRKRLEIARAMATRPRLLLLDEVTGGVDQASVPGLIALIARLRSEGVTLLVIEHNMRVIMSLADRIIALHLGKKIADGRPRDVIADPVVITAYLGAAYVGAHA